MRPLLALAAVLGLAFASPAIAEDDTVRTELASAKPVWYDASRDDWKRVEPRPPDAPSPSSSRSSSSSSSAGPMAATLFAYVLAATAIALLLWLATLVVRGSRALVIEQRTAESAPLRRADISALAFAPREGHADPEGALAAALKKRDWALAVIWLYTLMLLRLDRAGVVRLAPGKTNGVYRAEAKRGPATAASALGEGIALFERSYFGHLPVSEQEVVALSRRRQALDSAVAAEKPT